MTFELSYAGVKLCVPTPEVLAWVRRVLPRQALVYPGPLGWPASSLAGLGAVAAPVRRRGAVGSLYWPAGASRCACAFFLASWSQLDGIRVAVPDNGRAPLVLDTGGGAVTVDMAMLPPRPLSGGVRSLSRNNDPAYLVTLVDDRHSWWDAVTDDTLAVSGDTTTWNDLIDALAALLGIAITADTVDTDTFGFAPDGLDLSGLPVPVVLDAVCYACGLRISRSLDGTVYASGADTDYDVLANNLDAGWPEESGGPFALDPDGLPETFEDADDQPFALPQTVRVVFRADDGPHVVDVATADQDDLLSNAAASGRRTWVTRRAGYDDTAATAYARAFARDFGIRLISAVTRRYAGIVPWTPDGTSEAVEWVYRLNESATIVHPAPWDDGVTEIVGIPAAAGAPRLSLVRTTSSPWCLAGLPRIYPAAVRLNNTADLGYHAGDAVWLVQADDDPLDTRGDVTYAATLKHRDYTVETDAGPVTHDLYVTTGRISLARAICNPDGTITEVFTGEFEGCQDDDAMSFEGEVALFAGEGVEFE